MDSLRGSKPFLQDVNTLKIIELMGYQFARTRSENKHRFQRLARAVPTTRNGFMQLDESGCATHSEVLRLLSVLLQCIHYRSFVIHARSFAHSLSSFRKIHKFHSVPLSLSSKPSFKKHGHCYPCPCLYSRIVPTIYGTLYFGGFMDQKRGDKPN